MEEKIKEGFAELLLGQNVNDVKCFEKAKLCFQEVLRNNPIDITILSDAYRGLGIADYELNNFLDAITNLSYSIDAYSANEDIKSAYFYRGKSYLESGCEDFKKAIELGYIDIEGVIEKHCINRI